MELTIGILSYNTKDLLRNCLNSIYDFTRGIKYEIIVLDNASRDGSSQMIREEFPKVRLILNKKNRFFAKGYNQIIKIAKGKNFLMLNSDTYLKDNAFKKLLDFMEKNNLVACEGLEVKPDGNIIQTGSLFRSIRSDFYELSIFGRLCRDKKYLERIRMKRFNRKKNFEVDVGCNAYSCVNTNILREIGGYDEKFKLYYTEDDISKRIKERGHSIFHCGESFVFHHDAASSMKLGWKRIEIFYEDLLTYHKKYSNTFFASLLFALLKIELPILKLLSAIRIYYTP